MATPSILVIGATGRSGLHLITKAHEVGFQVHAFVRTRSKLSSEHGDKCVSIQEGDARNVDDISKALKAAKPTFVIIAIGEPNDLGPTEVREESARALADAIASGTEFENVKVIAVSSLGAGGTKIEIGWGIGAFVMTMLRHVLKDHNEQERILKELGAERVLICRPTRLGDGDGGKEVVEFVGKAVSNKIDRADVALWIINRIKEGKVEGEVNITGAP